jgi:hypothetical protein
MGEGARVGEGMELAPRHLDLAQEDAAPDGTDAGQIQQQPPQGRRIAVSASAQLAQVAPVCGHEPLGERAEPSDRPSSSRKSTP